MTTETLMSEAAATTTEGAAASQSAAPEGQQAQGTAPQQQSTEGQTAEGQKAEGGNIEGEQGTTETKPGAPEKYEFKAPEGGAFDDAVLGAFSEVAKELNLPQDEAQKVIDKVAPVLQARQAEQLAAVSNEWAQSARVDKEFGGDKLDENLATAKKALDAFASPELRTLLNESGLGNHPEMIRLMYRAGKAISEDRFVAGKTGSPQGQRDHAKSLYPSQQ